MKKQFLSVILMLSFASAAFLFIGCPYSSSVPLAKPDQPVPEKMPGKWQNPQAGEKNYYEIKELNSQEMTIIEFTWNEEKRQHTEKYFTAHVTTIDDTDFLNVQNEGTYYFYKLELGRGTITLYPVTEYIDESFTTSEELQEFFKKYKHLSFFYGKEITYEEFEGLKEGEKVKKEVD